MSEAFVVHNVHDRVLKVHIRRSNLHVWVLKTSRYNRISSFSTKIGLLIDSTQLNTTFIQTGS